MKVILPIILLLLSLLTEIFGSSHCDPPSGTSHTCTSYGDPHITSFDGAYYSIQARGDFYLVREISSDFVVQARQFSCGPNVACNGAVAIKYLDLTFYVFVNVSSGAPSTQLVGDASVYNVKIINYNGNSFYFSAPTGASVNVTVKYGARKVYYLDLLVTLNDAHYLKRIHGLCGAFDGNITNEFTLKNGTVLKVNDQTAITMTASWTVPAAEDLFNNAHCVIPFIFGAVSSLGLPGSAIGCLPPTPSIPSAPHSPLENCTCQNGCVPTGQQPAIDCANFTDPVLYARAIAACTYINPCCMNNSAAWGYSELYNRCLCDYNAAQGADFLVSSLNAYDQACEAYENSKGKTCHPCPNSCSGRGTCDTSKGTCVCNLGASGADCHEDSVTCSVALSLSTNILTLGCNSQDIIVNGEFFYGTNLQCRFGSSLTVPATKISEFQVKCTVPATLTLSPVFVYVLTQANCQLSTAALILL